MAIIYADGFPYDKNSLTNGTIWWSCYDGWGSMINVETGGRFGGRWMSLRHWGGQPNGYVRKRFPTTYSTVMIQFGYLPRGYNESLTHWIVGVADGTTAQIGLGDNMTKLEAYLGATGSPIASVVGVFQAGVWYQIEMKVVIAQSPNGSLLVKVNGNSLINLTGIDTAYTAHEYADGFWHGSSMGAGSDGLGIGISDLIVLDTSGSYCNDLLGFRQVLPLMPTADGTKKMWTPSSGSDRYAMVDEIPPDEADYNKSSAVDDIDSFVIPDLTNLTQTIDAVVCSPKMKLLDAGLAKVRGYCKSGGAEGLGTEVQVANSASWEQSVIYVDPNTGNPFTAANFNAAEFGYKRSA